ncbi:hypothetical protein FDP41_004487 [Naegleria fowleri]|uniref:Uncharacterized protein n=1 Tax=Naegleria fowleri TaxID=5763 RepID=A0A6A5BQU0_NAEFO|nr:uncharacterized protein FDP41_004487 [Naegleria fowleri]KAF0976588.1 hypothetical protein FDP41_004487 [Naegleria fowleri]
MAERAELEQEPPPPPPPPPPINHNNNDRDDPKFVLEEKDLLNDIHGEKEVMMIRSNHSLFNHHGDHEYFFNQSDELADDMVFHILQFLESEFIFRVCMKVSYQWYRKSLEIPLSLDFSHWSSLKNIRRRHDVVMQQTSCPNDGDENQVPKNSTNHSMDQRIQLLSHCFNLRNLTSLNLSDCCNKLNHDTWQVLFSSEVVQNISLLNLSENEITFKTAQVIAKNGHRFKHLTNLNLSNCNIGSKALKTIIQRPFAQNIKILTLSGNPKAKNICKHISSNRFLKTLCELNLGQIQIYSEGVKLLVESEHLTQIQSLNLQWCDILNNGITTIASNPRFCHLTFLNCDGNQIGDEGVKAIATSEYMKHLTTLELESNVIGNEGVQFIASSPFMTHLTFLNLKSNYSITVNGVKALTQSDKLRNLIRLYIPGGGKEVIMIDSSISQLRKLDLSLCSFSPCAFYNAGYKYYNGGDGIIQDYAKAFRYFELSALKESDKDAYYFLGMMSLRGNVPQNTLKGIEYLEESSKLGDVDALLELGQLYISGILVEQDSQKAFQYFEHAAKNHDPAVLIKLAYLYYLGYGTCQNLQLAHEYYELAAKQNAPVALLSLGYLYFNGMGVEKDERKALAYYDLAAKQHHDLTLTKLGMLYLKGQHVPCGGGHSNIHTSHSNTSNSQSSIDQSNSNHIGGGGGGQSNSNHIGDSSRCHDDNHEDSLYETSNSHHHHYHMVFQGIDYLVKCAQRHYVCAMRELAQIYLFGLYGMERNDQKAMYYMMECAEKHDQQVLMMLGLMYYCGHSALKYIVVERRRSKMDDNSGGGEESVLLSPPPPPVPPSVVVSALVSPSILHQDIRNEIMPSTSTTTTTTTNNNNNNNNTTCKSTRNYSFASLKHCVHYLKLANVLLGDEYDTTVSNTNNNSNNNSNNNNSNNNNSFEIDWEHVELALKHVLHDSPSQWIHYHSECTACRRVAFTGRFRYTCNKCLQYVLCEKCYFSNRYEVRDGHFKGMDHYFVEEEAPIHRMSKFLNLRE